MVQLYRLSEPKATYMTDQDQREKEDKKLYYEYRRTLRKVLTPTEYFIFDIIEDKVFDTNEGYRISYSELSDLGGGLATHTINNAVLRLEELGLVIVDRPANFNQKIPNRYHPVKTPTPTLVNFLNKEIEKILDAKNAAKDSRVKKCSDTMANNAATSLQKMQTNVTNNLPNNELKTTPNGVGTPPPKALSIEDEILAEMAQEEINPLYSSRLVEPQQANHTYPALPETTPSTGDSARDAGGAGGWDKIPRSKARDKPAAKSKKEPDPNSTHPACLIWQETHKKKLPNEFQMVDIVAQVGDDPAALVEWRECLIYYARHPHWNQIDSDRILDCYKRQNYKKGETYGQGGSGKPGYRGNGPGAAYVGAGSNGRGMGKSAALGRDGRYTEEQLETAW